MAREYEDVDGSEEKDDLGFRDAPALTRKHTRILDACKRRDIDDLQSLAISRGGFLTDAIRCQACECPARRASSIPLTPVKSGS